MSASILIAVTHLLGSGHFVRARHLARALARAGHAVTLASGGMPMQASGIEPYSFVQLPPVKVEGVDFRNLLDEAGRPIDAAHRAARVARLVSLADAVRPDCVITEHFPFGRRQLAVEFTALIESVRAANPAALTLASIRDVLVAPRADRILEAHARLLALFDGVLVHGDRDFLPLQASWPVSDELAARLHYTGYMEGDPPAAAGLDATHTNEVRHGSGEILVSGGGSGAAFPLFEIAIAAARLVPETYRWRILAGRGLDPEAFAQLKAEAPAHVALEWARPDFRQLLAACAVSISQAGYNTVLDLVHARCPAIVVPFDAGNETEQTIRAQALARAGLASTFALAGQDALTPLRLAEAVIDAMRPAERAPASIDRNGATRSAQIVARLLLDRR